MDIEKLYDSYLNVNTIRDDIIDDITLNEEDNTYELTSYFFLERLFGAFPFSDHDHLVDFGCGKGRVLFMASEFGCPRVSGIENSQDRYAILLKNIDKYQHKHGILTNFNAHNVDAQSAEIDDTANLFFFFEPFHTEIFKQVLTNIEDSLKRKQREITIFLYLPHKETLDHFDSIQWLKKEIHVEASLFYQSESIVTMPQYAFYANYSIENKINPNFLLY